MKLLTNASGQILTSGGAAIEAPDNITHDSLIFMLNALPTTQTALTLTLGTYNLGKLSAAEKQIATDKGWTLV